MERIRDFIENNFEINSKDEKIDVALTPFEYLSNHHVCKLPKEFKGPRYQSLKDIVIEIQTRTLCMHSWAAVSHYLDYKTPTAMDSEQKQELRAIAGLFYVADQNFERFYQSRLKLTADERAEGSGADNRLTFEEFSKLLRLRFPNRRSAPVPVKRKLFQEVLQAGYFGIEPVDRDIRRGKKAMEQYERHKKTSGSLSKDFADVGAVRIALRIANELMRNQSSMPDIYEPYSSLISPP